MKMKLQRCQGGVIVGACVVCEDPKGSVHFGVVSCAACSAFFRRTIAENRKYSCRRSFDGHLSCPIDQNYRCYCRACRLQKCLLMGMDPGCVQLHRDLYGSKVKPSSLEASLSSRSSSSSSTYSPISCAGLEEQLFALSRTTVFAPNPQILASGGSWVSTDQLRSPTPVVSTFDMQPKSYSDSSSAVIIEQQRKNMIETMIDSYRQLLERRRLVYCPGSMRDILGGTMPTLRPACYYGERVRRDRLRVDIALFVEFLNTIQPFPSLELDDKF
ncbi:unnamed protein product [Cylicocyclus nassatus]|uniref:Nuclear receptor domain-containing protein n=1 Tax=Cylicocyclus nassatus TaxID=53992 RepID=A0AA36H2F5_CYLNA|nr:unnamed protein product [Cylicocyclus nassatus]